MIAPLLLAALAAQDKYEPYVAPADIYAHPAHRGRGGWTWYTGSAGWMYRAIVESILGLRRRGAFFSVQPSIPAVWNGFSLRWRFDQVSTERPHSRTNPAASSWRKASSAA